MAVLADQGDSQVLIGHYQGDMACFQRPADRQVDRPLQVGRVGEVNVPAVAALGVTGNIGIASS